MKKKSYARDGMSRSEFLSLTGKSLLIATTAGSGLFACNRGTRSKKGRMVTVDAETIKHYLLSCRKPNGAFGPIEQDYTDLAWNYPAVHALRLLNVDIPDVDRCIRNGSLPSQRMPLAGVYQKAMLDHILGKRSDSKWKRSWTLEFGQREAFSLDEGRGVFHDMESLWHLVAAITISGGRVANSDEIRKKVADYQERDGSIAGHIIDTSLGVLVLKNLGYDVPHPDLCVSWLQNCQDDQGGFRWSPDHSSFSNKPDIWYTWAAVKAFDALNTGPKQSGRLIEWTDSLRNADGGFGDRPGWYSRIESTFHALEVLNVLIGDVSTNLRPTNRPASVSNTMALDGYHFFQAHHKSPPGGPEMIEVVKKMRYDLIGVKAQDFDVTDLRAYVREQGYSLEVLANPEVYEHIYDLRGKIVDHISNFILPPSMSDQENEKFQASLKAGAVGLEWDPFAEKVIRPMLEIGTLFYPEWDHGKINAYRVYDDGLDGKPGYNAIHAAHRNGPDRVRMYPYRERWLGHHTFLADGDAHRPIETPREFNNLMNFRNVYLADKPGWSDYLDASLNLRSVCIIRDPELPSGISYYGERETVRFLKQNKAQWQWWVE